MSSRDRFALGAGRWAADASRRYAGLLAERQIRISMSRKGNRYDSAARESFVKTLKSADVRRAEYRGLADAHARIGLFLERVRNQQRPTRRWATCLRPRSSAASSDNQQGSGA